MGVLWAIEDSLTVSLSIKIFSYLLNYLRWIYIDQLWCMTSIIWCLKLALSLTNARQSPIINKISNGISKFKIFAPFFQKFIFRNVHLKNFIFSTFEIYFKHHLPRNVFAPTIFVNCNHLLMNEKSSHFLMIIIRIEENIFPRNFILLIFGNFVICFAGVFWKMQAVVIIYK